MVGTANGTLFLSPIQNVLIEANKLTPNEHCKVPPIYSYWKFNRT